MTPNEFKAWFDGFTEAFTGCPTKAQWARIKSRVDEIDGKSVTERIYVDRYVRPYPYWQYLGTGVSAAALGGSSMSVAQNCSSNSMGQIGSSGMAFNSSQAMNELGRAEASTLV